MIPRDTTLEHPLDWQNCVKDSVQDPTELRQQVDLRHRLEMTAAANSFPLRIPRNFLQGCAQRDESNSVLRQFIPDTRETLTVPGWGTDPVGDSYAQVMPGVLHKYHGRVLLITTGACPVHCRYCFRRSFPYQDSNAKYDRFASALRYIAQDSSVWEVILSGGDPLMLPDRTLAQLNQELSLIPHVTTLRVHTRFPVVIPQRVTAELCHWLSQNRLQKVIVLHCNHPAELSLEFATAINRLRAAGVTILNQSVLLKGVNDSVDTLVQLSLILHRHGILPYYLHLLDPVAGSQHFHVDDTVAVDLHARVAEQLPGYLVPRLVREIVGEPGKTPVFVAREFASQSLKP